MKIKSKICHVTTVHPLLDIRVFYKECKTLLRAGYNVTLIVQHNQNNIVEGVKIVALSKPRNRLERMFLTTWQACIKSLKEKADIYHFHDPELIPIGIILKILGKKVIYDVHENYKHSILYSYYIPSCMRGTAAFLTDLTEKTLSRFFDAIVTATDDILKKFSHHKKAVVITNFPILSKLKEVNSKITCKNNGFNLIYVGGLSPERGISEIVMAMGYLDVSKDAKLILCGAFSPPKYEQEVMGLRGFAKVVYLGWIRPEEAWLTLSQANAGIVCFHPEKNHIKAMPNKLFEFMAAGLPVIASNFPLWKEIVEGNNCGVCVNPLAPKEIAEAINYLIENPDVARKMGENGRKAVLERYNWELEGKKLLMLYKELLS